MKFQSLEIYDINDFSELFDNPSYSIYYNELEILKDDRLRNISLNSDTVSMLYNNLITIDLNRISPIRLNHIHKNGKYFITAITIFYRDEEYVLRNRDGFPKLFLNQLIKYGAIFADEKAKKTFIKDKLQPYDNILRKSPETEYFDEKIRHNITKYL